MKADPEITTPAAYIAALPEDRRAAVRALDKLIRKAAPKLKPHLYLGMSGYGPYRYRYGSGREGNCAVIALASQKNYISLYVCATDRGQSLVEKNKARLGKVSVGRGCVRFKKLDDLDLAGVTALCKRAAALPPAFASD